MRCASLRNVEMCKYANVQMQNALKAQAVCDERWGRTMGAKSPDFAWAKNPAFHGGDA